jgi:hypothetical protein
MSMRAGTAAKAAGAAEKDPARAVRRLRRASSGVLFMLILQFVLGMGVNLYITPAKGGVGEAFSNGPLLALHSVLGLLLIISAIDLVVRAIRARQRLVIGASVLGLAAIAGAAANGVVFLKNAQAGASMGMAVATAVAMLCYVLCLRTLPATGTPSG